jgi:hypothetical protein
MTRGLGVSGLIRRTAPFSRLLRRTRGCGGSILTRILTGTLGFVFAFWMITFDTLLTLLFCIDNEMVKIPRQRVISLETQVEITSQRNKGLSDPRTYRR